LLSLLSSDLFVEVKKKTEDELKQTFGPDIGKLLFEEANCEEIFMTTNVLDGVVMEPLDSEDLQGEARRNARRNAESIRHNILKLVRSLADKSVRDRLVKEFYFSKQNEISGFTEVFKQMQALWQIKLTTPLEEVQSVQAQLKILKERQKELQSRLKTETENLSGFKEQSKELKAQKQKEKEALNNAILAK